MRSPDVMSSSSAPVARALPGLRSASADGPLQFSLAHLTLLNCAPPELTEIAARAGYDFVSLRPMGMGNPGDRCIRWPAMHNCDGARARPWPPPASSCSTSNWRASSRTPMCRSTARPWNAPPNSARVMS